MHVMYDRLKEVTMTKVNPDSFFSSRKTRLHLQTATLVLITPLDFHERSFFFTLNISKQSESHIKAMAMS